MTQQQQQQSLDPFLITQKESCSADAFAFKHNVSVAQLLELNPPETTKGIVKDKNGIYQIKAEKDNYPRLRVPPSTLERGPLINSVGQPPLKSIDEYVSLAKSRTTLHMVGERGRVGLFSRDKLKVRDFLERRSSGLKPTKRKFPMPNDRLRTVARKEAIRTLEANARGDQDETGLGFDDMATFAEQQSINEDIDQSPLATIRSRYDFKHLVIPKTSVLCWYPSDQSERRSNLSRPFTLESALSASIAGRGANNGSKSGTGAGGTNKSSFHHSKRTVLETTCFPTKLGCPVFRPGPSDRILRMNQIDPCTMAPREAAARALNQVRPEDEQFQVHSVVSSPPAVVQGIDGLTSTFVVEVCVMDQAGGHVKEVWHFKPDAPITQLFDLIGCGRGRLPYPMPKNAMLFLGGSFYLDDRHINEEQFTDLSHSVRSWNPFRERATNRGKRRQTAPPATSEEQPEPVLAKLPDSSTIVGDDEHGEFSLGEEEQEGGGGLVAESEGNTLVEAREYKVGRDFAFSTCPVKSASKTSFGMLTNITIGEYGAFRHYAHLNHLIYINSIHRAVVPVELTKSTETSQQKFALFSAGPTAEDEGDAVPPPNVTVENPSPGPDDTRYPLPIRYPYMLQGVGEKPLLCESCFLVPSTILSYLDTTLPRNPFPFCRRCFTQYRGFDPLPLSPYYRRAGDEERYQKLTEEFQDKLDGSVLVQLPPFCYFSAKD